MRHATVLGGSAPSDGKMRRIFIYGTVEGASATQTELSECRLELARARGLPERDATREKRK